MALGRAREVTRPQEPRGGWRGGHIAPGQERRVTASAQGGDAAVRGDVETPGHVSEPSVTPAR